VRGESSDSCSEPRPRIHWLGPSPYTDADLIGSQNSRREKLHLARAFLTSFLQNGPRPSRMICTAARLERLRPTTLRRAATELEIRFERIGFGPRQIRYWLLPGQELPAKLLPEGTTEVKKWLHCLERNPVSPESSSITDLEVETT